MASENAEVIKQSVTKNDYTDDAGKKGGVYQFLLGSPLYPPLSSIPRNPPSWWSFSRDEVLRATVHYESMWSNAIYAALTKMSSLSWQVKGPVPLQVKRAQELLLHTDSGMSWTKFIQKHLRDYLLTDNGAFIEIVRSSSSIASKIIGLIPLDSRRCTRTGDPDIPIIYRDKLNRPHEMKDYQVICMSDMPDPQETYYGVGFCAASRAYRKIYEMANLEAYVSEKVTGQRPLKLWFVSGVAQPQIDNAVKLAEAQAHAQGYTSYMGAVVIANIDPSSSASVAGIDLAGLPDRFEPVEERKNAYLTYADAIGIDPQELDPQLLASKAIGTGSQSKVIDDKASGKGLEAWKGDFAYHLNEWVLSEKVWFFFKERDYRDLTMQAQLESVRTQTQAARIASGIITAEEAKQLLADEGDVPQEFLTADLTTTLTLAREDKFESNGSPSEGSIVDPELSALLEGEMSEQSSPEVPIGEIPGNGMQGGNPATQGMSQDMTKEYAQLKVDQAMKEVNDGRLLKDSDELPSDVLLD